jgi:hypothetical protein
VAIPVIREACFVHTSSALRLTLITYADGSNIDILVQTTTGAAQRAEWEATVAGLGKPVGWKVHDCDMVVSYWLRSGDDLKALATDPEWPVITQTEKYHNDMDRAEIIIGWETMYMQDGNIVNCVPTEY